MLARNPVEAGGPIRDRSAAAPNRRVSLSGHVSGAAIVCGTGSGASGGICADRAVQKEENTLYCVPDPVVTSSIRERRLPS